VFADAGSAGARTTGRFDPWDVPEGVAHASGTASARASNDDPTQEAIPAVKAAVRAARRGDPIPSPLVPPLPDLLRDDYPPFPVNCWEVRDQPRHLQTCTLVEGTRGTIVLIGDSHAREWITPLVRLARMDDWRLVPLWHLGCWPTSYDAGHECQTFVHWAKRQVRILRPDVVLIGGAFKYRTPEIVEKNAANVEWLVDGVRPYADHVAVIGDPPALRFQPTHCLSAPHADLGTCTSTLGPAQISVYVKSRNAAERAGGAFMNTIGWFCFRRRCPAVVGHIAPYREDDHVSYTYALSLGYRFHAAFVRAVSR